jgi:hypothetical protein
VVKGSFARSSIDKASYLSLRSIRTQDGRGQLEAFRE